MYQMKIAKISFIGKKMIKNTIKGISQLQNLNVYVRNNPVNLKDPVGLQVQPMCPTKQKCIAEAWYSYSYCMKIMAYAGGIFT